MHRNNFLQEIASVGRVGEDPREDVRVDVGVVECQLNHHRLLRQNTCMT